MLKTLAFEQKSIRLEFPYINDFGLFQLTLFNTQSLDGGLDETEDLGSE